MYACHVRILMSLWVHVLSLCHVDIMHVKFYLHNCLLLSFILTISIRIGSALRLRYVVQVRSPPFTFNFMSMHVLYELHIWYYPWLLWLLFDFFFMRHMLYTLLFDLTPLSYDSAWRSILGTFANSALWLWLRMIVCLLIM